MTLVYRAIVGSSALVVLLTATACGGLRLPDGIESSSKGGKSATEESGSDAPPVHSDPTTDKECTWVIAESWPVQARGDCRYTKIESTTLTIRLPQYKPVDDHVTVRAGADKSVLIEKVTYDAVMNSVTFNVSAFLGNSLQLFVTFSGTDLPGKSSTGQNEGTLRKMTEPDCYFKIETKDTTKSPLLITKISEQFAVDGLVIRFDIMDEIPPTDNKCAAAGTWVSIGNVSKADETSSPSGNCKALRAEFVALNKQISAGDKSCTDNKDCVGFGYDSSGECPGYSFTAVTTFANFKTRHDNLQKDILAACGPPQLQCDREPARTPLCAPETKTCTGGF